MEEILPPQTQNGAGFELTRLRQFTVFLENRVGRLQMLMRAIETSNAGIAAICIEESADSALVRLICIEAERGRDALRTDEFAFSESELLAVELPQSTKQPLTALCSTLLAAEINIHYVYALLLRARPPAVALYVEDPTLAAQLLIKKGFVLIGESDLRGRPDSPGAMDGLN